MSKSTHEEREKTIAEIRDFYLHHPEDNINKRYVDFLLSELERKDEENRKLREERNKLIEGLRWYADRDNYRGYYAAGGYWKSPANDEKGNRAREILKEFGVNINE